jgi:DNA invertase Pin-like site-specific DNA recombinase
MGDKLMESNEKRQRRPAFGYTRTSSATNLGEGKDSVPRQRKAIQSYANRAGYKIVDWFDDGDVKGADPVESRPGFTAMMEAIASNGCRTIIVETANRFSRDLMVQEAGYARLKSENITLIAADKPDSFTDDSPMAVAFRQMLGVISQLDKSMTVVKLRGARERKRAKYGKCEGRKSMLESNPHVVQAAHEIRHHNARMSLRAIAIRLAERGYLNSKGSPFAAKVVRDMLAVSGADLQRALGRSK